MYDVYLVLSKYIMFKQYDCLRWNFSFGLICRRFNIFKKISVIVKVEICIWRITSGYKITPKITSINTLKTLFQNQNDLKYEMFHYMSAPSSRIKWKAEIENQKTHYWKISQWVTCVYQFFSNRVNRSFSSCTWRNCFY